MPGSEPGWLFRVASSPKWGGGHVARCRALGRALSTRSPVTMLLDPDGGNWLEPLEREGFEIAFADRVPVGRWCGSLLDGYGFSEADARSLRAIAPPLVALDDLRSPPRQADLVINPGPEEASYEMPALLGPCYALIDDRYRSRPRASIRPEVGHVAIIFGRYDACDATGLALSAVDWVAREGVRPRLSVVLGGSSPNLETVRKWCKQYDSMATLLIDHHDMPALLKGTDLVIGAGGVGLYERLALGIPSLTVRVSDNQIDNITVAARHGGTIDMGSIEQVDARALAENVLGLARSVQARQEQSRRGQALVDGCGPERVAVEMSALARRYAASVESGLS